jgi:ComF family protein
MSAGILSRIFPHRCVVCGARTVVSTHGVGACCTLGVQPLSEPACRVCGRFIGVEGVCLTCAGSTPPYDRLIAAARFDGPIRDMIHAFKYGRATYLKKYLGLILYEAVKDDVSRCEVVAAVPMHWTRTLLRGYNQAFLLAGEVSRLSGKRLGRGVLRKTRRTPAQVGLPPKERARNLKGAFAAGGVSGMSVCVVDDVITTGSTAHQVCRALKDAGATYVIFSGAARSVL